MGNIEHGTCPNCKEWAADESGQCTECGHVDIDYEEDTP